jgi:hypothetical protein
LLSEIKSPSKCSSYIVHNGARGNDRRAFPFPRGWRTKFTTLSDHASRVALGDFGTLNRGFKPLLSKNSYSLKHMVKGSALFARKHYKRFAHEIADNGRDVWRRDRWPARNLRGCVNRKRAVEDGEAFEDSPLIGAEKLEAPVKD